MALSVEPIGAAPAAGTPPTVEPAAPPQGVAPAPAGPPRPPEDVEGSLPPELVQIPAVQALLAGSPPAVSAPIQGFEKTPEGKAIAQNKDTLLEVGMAFYRSLSGDLGVMFNQMKISGPEIQAADREGRLLELAPPIQQVNQMVGSAGAEHPLLSAGGAAPGGAAAAPPPGVAPMPPAGPTPMATPSPAKAMQDKILAQKLSNLPPGSPTSGPKPGEGRLLNQILKPVI